MSKYDAWNQGEIGGEAEYVRKTDWAMRSNVC